MEHDLDLEKRPQIAGLLFAAGALPLGVATFASVPVAVSVPAWTIGGLLWLAGLGTTVSWLWEEFDLPSPRLPLVERLIARVRGPRVEVAEGDHLPEWICPHCSVPGQTLHVIGHKCPQCGAELDERRGRAKSARKSTPVVR